MIRLQVRRGCAAAMAFAMLLSAVPAAQAATTPPPAPTTAAPAPLTQNQLLGRQVVHAVLADMEGYRPLFDIGLVAMNGEMRKAATKAGGFSKMAYDRLGDWAPMAAESAWDEFLADRPKFEAIVGDYLATKLTTPELQALADLLTPDFIREMRAAMLASMADESKDKKDELVLSPAVRAKLDAFKASREGKSVIKKADGFSKDKAFQAVGLELVAAWLPGTLRRFGERAEAAEAARHPAGWPG